MSRIGRLPIPVPSGVDVTITGREVAVKGPKGSMSLVLHGDNHSFSDVAKKVVSIINLGSVAAVETAAGAAVDPPGARCGRMRATVGACLPPRVSGDRP